MKTPFGQLAEQALILQCQLGDEDAFGRLVQKHHAGLRYFVSQLVGSAAAEDVLQDVWLTVFRKLGSLKDPGAFVAWLYRIARNKAYHAIRKPAHAELPEDCEIPDVGDVCELGDYQGVQVRQALSELSLQHREALILRFYEEMSYQDIAVTVACRVGTVRSRLHNAKKQLRKHLERIVSNER